MSNLDKLSSAGLIAPDATLSADEIAALEAMSSAELATLVGAHMTVAHEKHEEPQPPIFHVAF